MNRVTEKTQAPYKSGKIVGRKTEDFKSVRSKSV